MIEYLYNAIRAVASQDIKINAVITDSDEVLITDACCLALHDDKEQLLAVDGIYQADTGSWDFIIPGDATVGLKGRYWYCIRHNDNNLCFKEPIYLV